MKKIKKCTHYMIRSCGRGEYQCENESCLKIFTIKLKDITKKYITVQQEGNA